MAVAELSLPIGIRSSERCIQALLTLQRRVTLHHITYHITDTAAEVAALPAAWLGFLGSMVSTANLS